MTIISRCIDTVINSGFIILRNIEEIDFIIEVKIEL
jgi:hypothetical protein